MLICWKNCRHDVIQIASNQVFFYNSRRFIINVPDSAKENHIRICFQIELAYWYYLDFYTRNDSKLKKGYPFKEFASHVYRHIPFLQPHLEELDKIIEEWREYKQFVPTYGAIILCEGNTHVLLVQSYWAKSSWGFPKGKVNEGERPEKCAIREVYEETGFDITDLINPKYYMESIINEQVVRLYIVAGISRTTKFEPKTRYEIKACEWFPVIDLPNNKKDNTPKIKMGVNPSSFFMVLPFVKRIKGLTHPNRNKRLQRKSLSCSEADNGTRHGTVNIGAILTYKSDTDDGKTRRVNSKRQLFKDTIKFTFNAPSWINFKFDKAAILECIP